MHPFSSREIEIAVPLCADVLVLPSNGETCPRFTSRLHSLLNPTCYSNDSGIDHHT